MELFAQSLAADDQVVLEATFGAAKIAELIRPHVARVVVCDARRLAGSGSRKTDRRDAKKLAEMLASGYLDEVWAPNGTARTPRRLVARRASVLRARTRARNEVHAASAVPPLIERPCSAAHRTERATPITLHPIAAFPGRRRRPPRRLASS